MAIQLEIKLLVDPHDVTPLADPRQVQVPDSMFQNILIQVGDWRVRNERNGVVIHNQGAPKTYEVRGCVMPDGQVLIRPTKEYKQCEFEILFKFGLNCSGFTTDRFCVLKEDQYRIAAQRAALGGLC